MHLLMGENGAGKSTLMKIVAGLYHRAAGTTSWRGNPVSFTRPAEAFLDRESSSKTGWVNRRAVEICRAGKAVLSALSSSACFRTISLLSMTAV